MKKHIAIMVLLVSLVYVNSLFGDFIYDDYITIVDNDFIKSQKNLTLLLSRRYLTHPLEAMFNPRAYNIGAGEATYRPIATLSYFLNYALFKLNPFGYRLINLLIHIVNALFIYSLLDILFVNPRLSLFSAILFGIHPINVEVLNCTALRPNSLAFLFSLLAIILYFKFKRKIGKIKYFYLLASLFSALLAVFSKEIAVVLPLALILCEYYQMDFNLKRLFANWRVYFLYFFVNIFYLLVYFFVFPPKQEIFASLGIYNNLISMFDILGIYLKDMLFPKDLVCLPPIIPISYLRVVFAVILVLIFVYIVLKRRRFAKEISFAILWFFLWLLPSNNFINAFRIPGAYRFLYISIMGFGLLLSVLFTKLWERNARFLSEMFVLRRILFFACLGYFSIFTISANACWKNEMILYLSMVKKYPWSSYAHTTFGSVLLKYGNYQEAMKEFNFVLSQDRHSYGSLDLVKVYCNLGFIYRQEGQYSKAEQMYAEALKLFPHIAYIHTELGICYGQQGLYEKALQCFNKAKEINPSFSPACVYSGVSYVLMQKYAEAKREFLLALEIYPDSQVAKDNLKRLQTVWKEE